MSNHTQNRVATNSQVEHEDVLVAKLHTSCISVERTIRLEELGVRVENMPAHSKKILRQPILPEDFTRPYMRIQQRAKAFFERYGSACDIGTVFDHARGKLLIDTMTALEQEMADQKEVDRQQYERIASRHMEAIKADPDVQDFPQKDRLLELLYQRQPLWEDIEDKIDMTFSVMLIGASKHFDADLYTKMQDSIVAIKKGAFGSLIKELCATARNALDKAIKAETRVHTRTVDAVWAMVEKINELGFLDKRLRVVEKELRRYLAPLARGEALRDLDYEDFINLMSCFANQHWLVQKLDSGEPLVEIYEDEAESMMEDADLRFSADDSSTDALEAESPLAKRELGDSTVDSKVTPVAEEKAEEQESSETGELEAREMIPSEDDIATADGNAWFG